MKALEVIQSDVCGALDVLSKVETRYFVSFIDMFSKWTTVYSIKAEREVFMCFDEFMALSKLQTALKLKPLQTDGRGEYISTECSEFPKSQIIASRQTCTYIPQRIRTEEGMNRILLDMVRTMLKHRSVLRVLWAEAVNTAWYFHNKMSSRGLLSCCTPCKLWFGSKSDLSPQRVFDILAVIM